MGKLKAYIDEFGNNGLNFTNKQVSTHFIVTAIIVKEEDVQKNEMLVQEIRNTLFRGQEIKSHKVKQNHERRITVLNEIVKLDFKIYSFVIDKRELVTKGFTYKKSFYKFLHGLLDRELYKVYPNLDIIADEIGENNFMNSFKKYITKNHDNTLIFKDSHFGFVNSEKSDLIQIADFITGTLARCYDNTVYYKHNQRFLEIISDKIQMVKLWPNEYKKYTYESKDIEGFDERIADNAIRIAEIFLHDHYKALDEKVLHQVNCLEYLVFYFKNISPKNYISTFELIRRLRSLGYKISSEQNFRANVIGKLRDAGILISSSQDGYKIPMNQSDLYDYINHSNQIIQPMISRIKKARDLVFVLTDSNIDILNKEEYLNIKQMLDINN